MGKKGATSWFRAVKRAFKSPTKGTEIKSEQDEENYKKSDMRRMIEHKDAENIAIPCDAKTPRLSTNERKLECRLPLHEEEEEADQNRAFAVAMATSAAAKAAVATAQAAVEVIRLATPSLVIAERYAAEYAAVVIQSAFRGYLARRALRALKGVVQLQAFVRGYLVRKRAKMTLKYMQSLLRVQRQVCDQRKRLSTDSTISPRKQFCQIAELKSNSKSRSSTSSITADEDLPESKSKFKRSLAEAFTDQSKSRSSTSSVAANEDQPQSKSKHERSLAKTFADQKSRSDNPETSKTKQGEEISNTRDGFETPKTNTSASTPNRQPRYSPINTKGQNLLINSLKSPRRSRIRTLEAPSRVREAEYGSPAPETLRSKSAPRERGRESCGAKKRLSFGFI